MSPQAYQGDYISDLPAVVTPAVELAGGLLEVEVLTGPVAGAYVNKRVTAEQLAEYLLTGRLALTAGLLLTDAQAQLAAGKPLRGGVQYGLIGDWNSTGDDTQVVFVHAMNAGEGFRTNGTLVRFGLPSEEVVVDVIAGTAIPRIAQHTAQLATLAARAANLYAHYANNSVAPFNDLDSYLAAANANGGTLRLEGEATSLYISVNNRGGWPAYWDAAGSTIVVPDGLILRSSAAGLANFNFANFYLAGGANGTGIFNLTGQLPQTTSAGEASLLFNGQSFITVNNDNNVVHLDGGYYRKITGAGKYYLSGSVQVDDLTGASSVVDLRGGGNGTGTVKTVNGVAPDAAGNVTLATRDITAVPAAKRQAVVAANAPAVAEPDAAYFETYFYDEVSTPGSITKYHCGISVQADGSIAWKWFRTPII